MKIAIVSSSERGKTDQLLSAVAETLEVRGKSLTGIVRVSDYESRYANG